MSDTFHEGDIVRLKSGGPKMTVQDVYDSDDGKTKEVYCAWFETDTQPQYATFKSAMLERADHSTGTSRVVRG